MAAAKARGKRVGWIPYGQQLADDGRTLVSNNREQEVLATIRELGRLSYAQRDIAGE
jgi:hypothetical protein